jgi:Cdc6-like AAA superfamily ATPase
MKLFLLALGLCICCGALAQEHGDKERAIDIKRHRAMAAAHEAAAKCLESGQTEKACLDKLAKDCKGLGIGKYCGMRHQH